MYNHQWMPFNPPIPEPKHPGKSTRLLGALVDAEKLVQIALVLPCAAFIGWLLGDWIGGRLHFPLGGALGVAFGGAAGLFYVVRLAMDAVKEPPKPAKKNPDGKGSAGRPS